MKIREFILAALAVVLASCTQKASIDGQVGRRPAKKMLLYAYVKGDLREAGVQEAVGDDGFHFDITPEHPGFYLIGDHEKVLYPLFVGGGERLEVTVENNRLVLEGEADEVNRMLYRWEDRAAAVREHAFLQAFIPEGRSVKYELFFEELTALAKAQRRYAAELDSWGRRGMAELLKYKSEADLAFYALSYLRTQGRNIPDSVELCDYYRRMEPDRLFQDVRLLDIPFAGQMLDTYVWYLHRDKKLQEGEKYDYRCLREPALQQEYLLNAVSRFKYHDEYRELWEELRRQMLPAEFAQRLARAEKDLMWSAPGVEAKDFKGLTPDSTWLSLSDFRGKILVVDVWATWCSPCRLMMPYFVKLEKELEGRGVAFLSVCMGVSIERGLWLELLKKDGLTGHHCFIDSWTGEFARNYKITGVPRYMVFDRQGRVVSLNAPKPNKPGLKEMILKALENE